MNPAEVAIAADPLATFTVAAKRQRTPVIAELLLRPAWPPLRYQPRQYMLLGDPDAQFVTRAYSIANAPRHIVLS